MADFQRLNAALAGRYVIERELGHGGMATVYLARDVRHDRVVAVKVFRPDVAATLGAERFLREIRIAATLQHPHVLTLIDSGVSDDILYYVMPFAEGQSLRDRLSAGPIAVPDAIRWLRDVLDGLAHAHAHGVVHRDIKPDNIMLSGRHAVVVDFGVAKAMSAAKEMAAIGRGDDALTQIGTSIGTPAYMAPEQAAGDPDVNHSADIYAAGIVMYEMLAGKPPFTGPARQVLADQISRAPVPLEQAAPSIPPALARLVMKCIEKDPAARYGSAEDALAALESLSTPATTTSATRPGVRRGLALAGIAAVVIVAALGWMGYTRVRDQRWVHVTAVPEMRRLIDANQFDSAFALGTQARRIAPDDSIVNSLWTRTSGGIVFTSTPPGARVLRSAYEDSLGWTDIGITPTDTVRVPLGLSRYRFELAGHHPIMLAGGTVAIRATPIVFQRTDSSDGRMVYVPGGRAEVAMPGLSRLPIVELPPYFIDRHEVTNAEYQRFVKAGGYAKEEYWDNPRVRTGFVDRTGRPGPSTWEAGDYPAGQGELPVAGVSWYEAAAYAKFAGKSLPTIYHWSFAATTQLGNRIIPGSNFGGQALQKGSAFRGMSGSGAFDMGGNVREWTENATGDKRFILGGGYSDMSYAFSDAYAQDPMDRSPINGIRLVKPVSKEPLGPPEVHAAIVREHRDYSAERPASDAAYSGYRAFFAYDRTPLNAKVTSRDTTNEFWIRERVDFDAAYGGERMGVVLYIPKGRTGPLPAIVVMGGSNMLYTRSDAAIPARATDYLVKSGRIVVWPIFKGMYDRNMGITNDSPMETSAYRDHMVMLVKDTRRSIDYLETRADVDTGRIAYMGFSYGGRVAPPILATESRFKAAVLVTTGLKMERTRAEVDPINFLPRIRMPLLMLNGRHDYYFPIESSQKPFFDYLGTPRDQKKWLIYEEAHTVPRTEIIRESLAWFDKYLR